jgi:hypothetical protein
MASDEAGTREVTAGCGRIKAFDDLDCGGKRGTGVSSTTEIGPMGGKAELTKAAHGSTWDYTIMFFKDASRPKKSYTLTERKEDYPDVDVSDLPMAPNCADGRPCWTIKINGCPGKGGMKTWHYMCLGGDWERLEEVDFSSFREDELPEGTYRDGGSWAVPGQRRGLAGDEPPFVGTRLAMGAE